MKNQNLQQKYLEHVKSMISTYVKSRLGIVRKSVRTDKINIHSPCSFETNFCKIICKRIRFYQRFCTEKGLQINFLVKISKKKVI